MTIGPAMFFLSWVEKKNNIFTRVMLVFGKVPLFYYVIHLFLIHTLALLLAVLTHWSLKGEIITGKWQALSKVYGFSMPVVYLLWLVVVALLYPACVKYGKLKASKKYKFLSFF